MRHVHIIGAGLAGLSAATALASSGIRVTLHEAGPAAGGRCRSYFDKALGLRIDNGNHLLLSGNDAAMDYLTRIGARDTLTGPDRALFPFMDLATGERWEVAPGAGRIPWWILNPRRRVPGTRLGEYLALARLRSAATVADALGQGPLAHRLLEPLAISALNTMPDSASARLMWAVVAGSLLRGGGACIPLVPRIGLSETFIDPAIAWLRSHGATLHTASRVSALDISDQRLRAIHTHAGPIAIGPDDAAILATPSWVTADLLPGLKVPQEFESILNVHFRIDADPGPTGFIGLVGGLAEWVFVRPGIVSVTISAANRFSDLSPEAVAERTWTDVRAALGLSGSMPPMRVIRERRATFAATPASNALRPISATFIAGLSLAGDWTATGLPATIEGAITSGNTAAQHLRAA